MQRTESSVRVWLTTFPAVAAVAVLVLWDIRDREIDAYPCGDARYVFAAVDPEHGYALADEQRWLRATPEQRVLDARMGSVCLFGGWGYEIRGAEGRVLAEWSALTGYRPAQD